VTGEREVEEAADRPDVGLLAVGAVGARVGEYHPALVADHHGAGVDVAVHHAGGVHGGEGAGHRVADRRRPARVEWAVGDQLPQRTAVHPFAYHVRPLALVDGVVDAHQVGVDHTAGGDGRLEHLGGRVAPGVAQHDRDGTA
jgi:hypothetical protein